jgi:hypothetical protein
LPDPHIAKMIRTCRILYRNADDHGVEMPIYEARVKLAGTGNVQQTVTVKADDNAKAKLLLEAQYGKGSVMTVPVKKG